MGYTHKTWKVLKPYIRGGIRVMDLGAQNDFTLPHHPFTRERYESNGVNYECIDVNGKGGSIYHDLGTKLETMHEAFDLVVDAGTKEHVKNLDIAFYNQDYLCRQGGWMYCENPKVGSWPDHGHHYFTMDFYKDLAKRKNYDIVLLEEHPCNTSNDGWEIICLMKK